MKMSERISSTVAGYTVYNLAFCLSLVGLGVWMPLSIQDIYRLGVLAVFVMVSLVFDGIGNRAYKAKDYRRFSFASLVNISAAMGGIALIGLALLQIWGGAGVIGVLANSVHAKTSSQIILCLMVLAWEIILLWLAWLRAKKLSSLRTATPSRSDDHDPDDDHGDAY